MTEPFYLARPDGLRLAYRHRPGHGPTLIFLPGYMSDMEGGKATALDVWAEANGRAMLRLDYSGRSEEHTSELQSLMRISYAVFCLKKKKTKKSYRHSRLATDAS